MNVDHLVYGAPDLLAGMQAMESLLGVRPALGGKHVGVGTHNALLALGAGTYLEIIAPDPDQETRLRPLPYGLDALESPRLVAWAIKAPEIDAQAARALGAGVDLGPVQRMTRERPDGSRLEWRLTRSTPFASDGLLPFLIAWGPGPHPSETSPPGARLVSLRAEHPEAGRITKMVDAAGADLPVTLGAVPTLIAIVASPHGMVELR